MPIGEEADRLARPPVAPPHMASLGSCAAKDPAISVSGTSKAFGLTRALDNVTLQVDRGSVYALVGPNGSGKSTLFRLITGLIRPDSGEIAVMGRKIKPGGPPPEGLGIVPQGGALYDYMSVGEHAVFASRMASRWDQPFVDGSLKGLEFNLGQKVRDLSSGRRVQLALVLALGQRPDLLILDELTANLDPIMRREVHRLVIGEASARGQTILLASHNLTEVERVADRVGFLRSGKLVAERVVEQIRERDHEVRVVFQGVPPTDLALLPGVASVEQQGSSYRLQVSGELDPLLAALNQLHPFALEVVEQSLEDLYFALNAGDSAGQKEA